MTPNTLFRRAWLCDSSHFVHFPGSGVDQQRLDGLAPRLAEAPSQRCPPQPPKDLDGYFPFTRRSRPTSGPSAPSACAAKSSSRKSLAAAHEKRRSIRSSTARSSATTTLWKVYFEPAGLLRHGNLIAPKARPASYRRARSPRALGGWPFSTRARRACKEIVRAPSVSGGRAESVAGARGATGAHGLRRFHYT